MRRKRWVFSAVAIAGVVALVAPAVGQGKVKPTSLWWSVRGGAILRSNDFDFGAVDAGARASMGFRLGNSSLTKSGTLKIRLAGSPAFSITSDRCTGKSVGQKLSCWVGVAFAPRGARASGNATLRVTGEHVAAATLSLSGCTPSTSNNLYWGNYYGGAVNGVLPHGGCVNTLASGQYGSRSVAVDGTHLYWVNDGGGDPYGTVNEVSLGGGSVTTLATGQNSPFAVAVDGTSVYWVNSGHYPDYVGSVNKIPLGGGSVITLASGQHHPVAVAVDGTHVYWVDENYGDGTVNEVPLDGGPVTTLASGQDDPVSVAVDGTHVYWANSDYPNGSVNEVPLGGGIVTTLATGGEPVSLAIDGTHAYWADAADGTVDKVSLGGGPVTTLASAQNDPLSVAVDGTHVYWVNSAYDAGGHGPGTVNEVPLGGGAVATLARGQDARAVVVGH